MLYYKQNSKSFDSTVIQDGFINRVLLPHKLRLGQVKSLLYIDNAPCHKKQTVLNSFHANGINVQFIPPGMTSILQPADVSWMRFIKSEYSKLWTDWYLSSEKAFTANGNMKSPGYKNVNLNFNY